MERKITLIERDGKLFIDYHGGKGEEPSEACLILIKHGANLANISRGTILDNARLIMGSYVIAYDKAQQGSGHDAYFVDMMEHVAEDILRMRNLRTSENPRELIQKIEEKKAKAEREKVLKEAGAKTVVDFPVKKDGDDDPTIH